MSDKAHSHAHGHDGHGFAHPASVKSLLLVFFSLVGLTWFTVFQATQKTVDLGQFELVVTLFIATIKATLVILFFMHMIHDKPLNVIVFLSSFIFVALFLGFTLLDTQGYKDTYEFKNVDSPPPAAVAKAEH
jgi:cytochrome c oxidase subunit IV